MEIYPLYDCIMQSLDDCYDEILIIYYTDAPRKPYDAFTRKLYKIPDETPLYLCQEVWKWEDGEYVKESYKETILKKEESQALIKKYLRFMVPTHEYDFSYKTFYEKNKNYKHSLLHTDNLDYYNLGCGCRWNRAWEGSLYDDEDTITMMYGPIY